MRIMLVQIEVERVKFIVRSYVRTRLFKVRRDQDITGTVCRQFGYITIDREVCQIHCHKRRDPDTVDRS